MCEREACFGIVHKDLSPKPAFEAMKVLTTLCPNGSTRPQMARQVGRYVLSWTRPDGVKMWAVWHQSETETVSVSWQGELKRCLTDLGKEVPAVQGKMEISPSLLYFEGPEALRVE